jgi:hypothetical protein
MSSYRSRSFPGKLNITSNADLVIDGTSVTATGAELSMLDADNTEPTDAPWAAVSRWAKAEFSTAKGTTVATHDLGVVIPDNAVLLAAFIECDEQVVSTGSATISVGIKSVAVDNILAATGKASFNTTSVLIGAALAAAPIKLAAAAEVTATIAVQVITAGKFTVWLEYVVGEA